MNQSGNQTDRVSSQKALTITLATVAGQVGCLTFIIIIIALILGLALDTILDTRPLFIILFMVGSVPATWVVIFRIVNRAKKRIQGLNPSSSGKKPIDREEAERE